MAQQAAFRVYGPDEPESKEIAAFGMPVCNMLPEVGRKRHECGGVVKCECCRLPYLTDGRAVFHCCPYCRQESRSVAASADVNWNRWGWGYNLDTLETTRARLAALLRQSPTSCTIDGLRSLFLSRCRSYRRLGQRQPLRVCQIDLAALRILRGGAL